MRSLAVTVVVVAALYFGREIFVPIALAVLLSFALAPLVGWLRRRGVPRTPAVIVVVALAFLGIFAFGVVVAGQVAQLAENLPRYQYNIKEKIRTLRTSAAGGGIFERASEMLEELSAEVEGDAEAPAAEPGGPSGAGDAAEAEPIPVEIRQPEARPLEILQSIVGPLIGPLSTAGIVVVFVVFMLLQREDLRDRLIRLLGPSDLHRSTQALSDAGSRVGRYLLMQLVVNATYGVPVGIGLWIIGVPNPLLWGMLAMILRFVPYVGPIVAAILPLTLAMAVDPGWTMLLWTAALFIVLELVSNNLVEPWLYGSTTGLSPVAIIVAAIFWTWLWGPIGLLLSTPLTVCLVVLGQHLEQFAFLDVLLGSEPVLSPPERLYQRLLAGDPDEATERAEEFLEKGSLVAFYQEVAMPALAMMEHDRARGVLADDRRALVAAGALSLIDNLSEHVDDPRAPETAEGESAAGDAAAPAAVTPGFVVLSAGGRGNLDDVAATILAQLVQRHGAGARVTPFEALAAANYGSLDLSGVAMVCVSYLNTDSLAHARYLVRRLRRLTDLPVLVGFWAMDPEDAAARDLVRATRADFVETRLAEAVERIIQAAGRRAADGAEPPRAPAATAG
jgi:predicted PurR-regulated permease PerM